MSSPGWLGFSTCVANQLGSSGSCSGYSSGLIPACWPGQLVAGYRGLVRVGLELLVVRPRLLAGLSACSGCPPCPGSLPVSVRAPASRLQVVAFLPYAGVSSSRLVDTCGLVALDFGLWCLPVLLVSLRAWCHHGGGEGVLASLTLSLGVFRRPPSCCRMLLFRWGLAFIWPFVSLGFGPRVRLVVTLFFAVWASSCCRLVVPVWPFYVALLFLEGA